MKRLRMFVSAMFGAGPTLVLASAWLMIGCGVAFADATPFSRIVVFGDSVSDNGNIYRMSGETYPPSPPYWEGRMCNGPVWVEYLAQDLGMAGLLDDYAIVGATAGTANNGTPFGGVQNQMALYFESSSSKADPQALYIFWAGHNEVFMALAGDTGPMTAFIDNTTSNIKALWTAGARHIMVVNIIDVGKIPALVSTPYSAAVSALVAGLNQTLAVALAGLADQGVRSIAVDECSFMTYVATHPEEFGFTNVTDPGISLYPEEPTGYVFWDSAHPTTKAQHLMEQFAVRSLIDYFSPSRGMGMPPAQVNALNGLVRAGKGL